MYKDVVKIVSVRPGFHFENRRFGFKFGRIFSRDFDVLPYRTIYEIRSRLRTIIVLHPQGCYVFLIVFDIFSYTNGT